MNSARRQLVPLILGILCAIAISSGAADYYVDAANLNANDNNPGTATSPWKTITKANSTLTSGSTVYIRAGTYSAGVNPSRTGTATLPIVYSAYPGESPVVSNLTAACVISGKAYITVSGIQFRHADGFLMMTRATNCIVTNCVFGPQRSYGNWAGSYINTYSSSNLIISCVFSNWGSYSGSAQGGVFEIGTEEGTDVTHHNRIENCEMSHGGHHVLGLYGKNDIIRNNYFHNDAWLGGYGYRVLYCDATISQGGWNLIEKNRIAYAAQSYSLDVTSGGLDIINANNIVRRNQFYYNDGPGIEMNSTDNYICDVVFNYIYNNSFLSNGRNTGYGQEDQSMIAFSNYGTTWQIRSNYVKNNIYQTYIKTYGYYPSAKAATMAAAQTFASNWAAATQGDPLFVNAAGNNPAISTLPDLTIATNSPCVNAGCYLSTINSASGSGTSFNVADAHYFTDGWGIVAGDSIQLQGQSVPTLIKAVNYASGAITVGSSVTWTNGQGVALAYSGSAPNIGAYQYSGVLPTPPSPPTNLRIIGVGN